MAANSRWKKRERAAVRLLGAERLASNGHGQADALAELGGHQLAVEHKSRGPLPGWLAEALAQADRNAPAGTVPLVVLSAGAGRGHPIERVAVLRLELLRALLAPDADVDEEAADA